MSCCSGLTCADSLAVFVMWASECLRTSFICLISVSRSPSVPEWVCVRVNAGAHTDVADMSRLKGWNADYMNGAAHAQWWGIDSFTHLNKYKMYLFQVGIISLRKGGKVSAWVMPSLTWHMCTLIILHASHFSSFLLNNACMVKYHSYT